MIAQWAIRGRVISLMKDVNHYEIVSLLEAICILLYAKQCYRSALHFAY